MHTQEGVRLVETHALLYERKTYSSGADTYASRGRICPVKTRIPGKDMYPEAIIGFHH